MGGEGGNEGGSKTRSCGDTTQRDRIIEILSNKGDNEKYPFVEQQNKWLDGPKAEVIKLLPGAHRCVSGDLGHGKGDQAGTTVPAQALSVFGCPHVM